MSEERRTPFLQLVFDDFVLLMFIGVAVYAVSYLIWGLIEIAWLPPIPEEIRSALLGR